MSRFQARTGERLHWRALVRTTGALDSSRASHGLSWHLVECADPTQTDSHCSVGVHLLSTGADPDGHCLVDATCPRCALATAPVPPANTPAATLLPADTPPELSSESPSVLPVQPLVS
jgi:hypothetical protein